MSEQLFNGTSAHYGLFVDMKSWLKGEGRPYSITERGVTELIPVLGSQPAGV